MEFKIHSEFKPSGDQPQAIAQLVQGIENGLSEQTLLGVTGSGKTFTMASVIEKVQKPTLVLAHNKTLAAQLCSEFREFFPDNAVEYFISYYDYYQPEAYIAHTDTYIEKDSAINDEIERLRHAATSSLFERRDVIVVASVSCIYGLGDPIDYKSMVISLRPGYTMDRDTLLHRLIDIRYERNDLNFVRNTFRVRGDTVEIYPAYAAGKAIRVELFGDEVDRISEINPLTGMVNCELGHVAIYVKDVARSKAFYSDVLGFEELWYVKHENTGSQLQFMQQKGIILELVQKGGGQKQRDGVDGTINHLCMQVQDIEAAKAALETAGVVFETEIQLDPDLYENGEKSARFRGPDGEMLQIEQIL